MECWLSLIPLLTNEEIEEIYWGMWRNNLSWNYFDKGKMVYKSNLMSVNVESATIYMVWKNL